MRFLILFYATGIELKDEISLVTTPKDRNGSHIYEEIDINLQNGKYTTRFLLLEHVVF